MILAAIILYLLIKHELNDNYYRKIFNQLLDRLMARHLDEYKFFEHQFPAQVRSMERASEVAMKNATTEEVPVNELTQRQARWVSGLEEDFKPEEIDTEKLDAILDEEEKKQMGEVE